MCDDHKCYSCKGSGTARSFRCCGSANGLECCGDPIIDQEVCDECAGSGLTEHGLLAKIDTIILDEKIRLNKKYGSMIGGWSLEFAAAELKK